MPQPLTSPQIKPLDFSSGGERCSATLYRPAGDNRPPLVIMAHGFGGTQDARLPAFAQRFCQAGMAVMTFDYRHFGKSAGQPRQVLDIHKQLQDWRAAIDFGAGLAEVDGSRVAIWGTSFGGGHVLTIAAENPSLKAVVAQVPFTDGVAHAELSLHSLRLMAHGVWDRCRSALGLQPDLIGVVGQPGAMAAMTSPDSEPGYLRLVEGLADWHNAVAARIVLQLPLYRPTRTVDRIVAPVLYLIARDDVVTPVKPALAACRRTPRAERVMLEGGHFDPYVAPGFEAAVAPQVAFLTRHLGV